MLYRDDYDEFARDGNDTGFVPLRDIFDGWGAIVDPSTSPEPVTGYNDIDFLLGGLQRSNMIVLGSTTSSDTNSLALNIAVNAACRGAVVGIFSQEMSHEQLNLRILAADAEIDSHRLRLGLYTEAEEQRIIDSIGRLSELPIYIDDTSSLEMAEIQDKARRLSKEHGLDLLVMDHLQHIQRRRQDRDNRTQEISEISRNLKGIARELKIALITCSQLSRVVENRLGHRPQLSDLSDSGSIEEDADVVMFIHRDDMYYTIEDWGRHFPSRQYPRNVAEIIVAKHRNGPTGSVILYFHDNLFRFESVEQA